MDVSPSLYAELEKRARWNLKERGFGAVPDTASLVNQAWIYVAKGKTPHFETRAEFLAYCSKAMRSVLLNCARERRALKRGGDAKAAPLSELDSRTTEDRAVEQVIFVHEKLDKLAAYDANLARLVELIYFGGCTKQEAAQVLDKTTDAVESDWAFAKMWLRGELSNEE